MQKWKDEQEYIDCVLTQVHWKAAHNVIRTELSNHIADQREAFLEAGSSQDVAEEQAIAEMGEAFSVGIAFDKAYRPKIDWIILGATLGLLGFGIFAWLFSGQELIGRDFLFLALGGGILLVGCIWDYRKLFLLGFPVYLGYITLLVGMVFFGVRVNGRPSWLAFETVVSMQGLLLLFPLVFSIVIMKMRNTGIIGLLLCGSGAAIPFLWALWCGEMGAIIIPGVACFAMLFPAVKWGWFGSYKKCAYGLLCSPIAFAIGIICLFPYRFNRLFYGLNPRLDPYGYGYQGSVIQKAFINAEWIGTGDSTSYQQFVKYIPESEHYFALASLTQYFGVILFILVSCVIFVLLYRSNRICKKQKSAEGKLIATAALTVLGMSFGFGLLSNIGILLIPSVALPLVSYGKVNTLIYLLYIGVLISVLRNTPLTHKGNSTAHAALESQSRLSIKEGVLTFRFKD